MKRSFGWTDFCMLVPFILADQFAGFCRKPFKGQLEISCRPDQSSHDSWGASKGKGREENEHFNKEFNIQHFTQCITYANCYFVVLQEKPSLHFFCLSAECSHNWQHVDDCPAWCEDYAGCIWKPKARWGPEEDSGTLKPWTLFYRDNVNKFKGKAGCPLFCKELFVILLKSLGALPFPRLLLSFTIKTWMYSKWEHKIVLRWGEWIHELLFRRLWTESVCIWAWCKHDRCVLVCLLLESRNTRTYSTQRKSQNDFFPWFHSCFCSSCQAFIWQVFGWRGLAFPWICALWFIHNRLNKNGSILGAQVFQFDRENMTENCWIHSAIFELYTKLNFAKENLTLMSNFTYLKSLCLISPDDDILKNSKGFFFPLLLSDWDSDMLCLSEFNWKSWY